MLRHPKNFILRLGLVALILLASVPEVRCCCDVSWGPAGLFGSSALCAPSSTAQPRCNCCPQPEEQAPPEGGCGSGDCACSFTWVSPPAMAAGPSVESVQAPTLKAWIHASPLTIAGIHLAHLDLVEQSDSALMPSQRCALLQTWLV
jgi:hypothetical protein